MFDLAAECDLQKLSPDNLIANFDCGNADLNDFFCNDAIHYQRELLGQTLFFTLKEHPVIVAAFTLSNDSIKVDTLPNSRKKKVRENIPSAKNMRSYSATLIGRLGVSVDFSRRGIGTQILDFIKSICITEDSHKCRFLLVDAYNTEDAIRFYTANEFLFVFSTEEQEKEYYGKDKDSVLASRFMYFDLLPWSNQLEQE